MVNAAPTRWIAAVAYGAILALLTYGTERDETAQLLTLFVLSFCLYGLILKFSYEQQIIFWILASIAFRILLLPSTPKLTEDFYRFIWDGRLAAAGFHPLAHPPSYYISNNIVIHGSDDAFLYSQLNSTNYYSVYPPIAQFIFWLSAISFDSVKGSLLILKILVVAADVGVVWIIGKLLKYLNLSQSNVLIYALNPLVLIEISGNAHYESVMILLLLLAFYFIIRKKNYLASLFFALSIGAKLLPIMFVPSVWTLLPRKNAIAVYAPTAGICAMIFFPYITPFALSGLFNSLGYFFAKFEFNASIYYVVREVGYWIAGFNVIQVAGGVLAFIAALLILWISFRRNPKHLEKVKPENKPKQFLQTCVWVMTIYLFFTTIVHPWYLTTLLALSVFSSYRFPVVWTCLIFFTYAGYSVEGFTENYLVVILEYSVVCITLWYEFKSKSYPGNQPSSANQL